MGGSLFFFELNVFVFEVEVGVGVGPTKKATKKQEILAFVVEFYA
jgi:hypothetical protein